MSWCLNDPTAHRLQTFMMRFEYNLSQLCIHSASLQILSKNVLPFSSFFWALMTFELYIKFSGCFSLPRDGRNTYMPLFCFVSDFSHVVCVAGTGEILQIVQKIRFLLFFN